MSLENPERTVYVGDSIYLTNNLQQNGYYEIFTYNGVKQENLIYLEPAVAQYLVNLLTAMLTPPPGPIFNVDI